MVTIGDGKKCKVIGKWTIGKHPATVIENVDFAEGLAHNLLSVGQLCSMGFTLSFFNNNAHILKDDTILFQGTSLNIIYIIYLSCSNNLKSLVVS